MRLLLSILVVSALTACGTVGGAVSGAGEDLKTVGNYIKKVGN